MDALMSRMTHNMFMQVKIIVCLILLQRWTMFNSTYFDTPETCGMFDGQLDYLTVWIS